MMMRGTVAPAINDVQERTVHHLLGRWDAYHIMVMLSFAAQRATHRHSRSSADVLRMYPRTTSRTGCNGHCAETFR